MGYVRDMRQFIGHRTLMIVGAAVILEDARGRILLQRRTDNHCWDYAGGCVEVDEPVEDAARRELFEETGLTAGTLELLGVFSGPETHYTYPNGDDVSIVNIVYVCRDWTGTLVPQPEEVEELRFFPPEELPPMEQIGPPSRIVLKTYLERRKAAR